MPEIFFNASGSMASYATVRVESTHIGGQGGPAFPQMLIPLSITLKEVDPQWRTGNYVSTPDDPVQHYSLLQLSGTFFANNLQLGTFQTPPLTLNTKYNQGGTIVLLISLDLFRIEYMEERRSGDMPLRVDIIPWIAKHYETTRKDKLSGYEQFETNYHQLSLLVPQSHWVDKVLPGLGYGKMQLLEVPIPATVIGASLARTVSELQRSQDAMKNGDYNKALGSCRHALDTLSTLIPYKGEVKNPTFADKIDFLLASLPGTPEGKRRENLARLLKDLWGFTSIPQHASELTFSRDDAQMTTIILTAVLAYMSHFLDAAQRTAG